MPTKDMACGLPHLAKFKAAAQKPLQFGKDGKFRILHLTDIHAVMPQMDTDGDPAAVRDKEIETLHVIRKCIALTKPDLVVLGGDNVSGYWQEFNYGLVADTIQKIIAPIAAENIPLALVFGNHDSEIGIDREMQMCVYLQYANCRASLNAQEMFGCGTYDLTVKSSDGARDAYALFMMDSNDYPRDENGKSTGGYDCVHPDQLAWFDRRSEELKAANGGEPLPALLFQHIPVNQEYEFIREVPAGTEGALEQNGKYYAMQGQTAGVMREFPCPPKGNHPEQLEGWVKNGNVVAAFFGHDHVNSFTVEYSGIQLIQTIGAGYFSYGRERGGRLIVLDENNPRKIETETVVIPRITESLFI